MVYFFFIFSPFVSFFIFEEFMGNFTSAFFSVLFTTLMVKTLNKGWNKWNSRSDKVVEGLIESAFRRVAAKVFFGQLVSAYHGRFPLPHFFVLP